MEAGDVRLGVWRLGTGRLGHGGWGMEAGDEAQRRRLVCVRDEAVLGIDRDNRTRAKSLSRRLSPYPPLTTEVTSGCRWCHPPPHKLGRHWHLWRRRGGRSVSQNLRWTPYLRASQRHGRTPLPWELCRSPGAELGDRRVTCAQLATELLSPRAVAWPPSWDNRELLPPHPWPPRTRPTAGITDAAVTTCLRAEGTNSETATAGRWQDRAPPAARPMPSRPGDSTVHAGRAALRCSSHRALFAPAEPR
jgi:hypothetical protein